MAERDYRVTYKTREIDRDEDKYDTVRRRVPTALDPYIYPEDREELKREVAMTKARNARYRDEFREFNPPARRETFRDDIDDHTTKATRGVGTTKTTYSVTEAGLEKESEMSTRTPKPSAVREATAPISRQTTYKERDDYEAARPPVRAAPRYQENVDYPPRTDRVYDVERPKREAGAYVIDMGSAEVLGVQTGAGLRDSDRGFAGYRNDPYSYDNPSEKYSRKAPPRNSEFRQTEAVYALRNEARTSAPSVHSSAPYLSGPRVDRTPTTAVGSRTQTDFRAPPRTSTKTYEDEWVSPTAAPYGPSRSSNRREEEDFTFVEKTKSRSERVPSVHETFKDPFHDDPRQAQTPRGRPPRSTFPQSPSENDYVMVSPPRDVTANSTTSTSMRSALVREDAYTPEERNRRRRSRSISFRDADAEGHYAGDKFHERPGAEAAMMGKYLRNYGVEDDRDRMDYQYISKSSKREDDAYDRRERDDLRYPPQRMRSRSRGARRNDYDDDDDDRSYVDTFREKTSKTTYY